MGTVPLHSARSRTAGRRSGQRSRALRGIAAVGAFVLIGSGCVSADPRPTPEPSFAPTVTSSPTAVAQQSTAPSTVPFPASIELSLPSRNVVWALVGGQLLFRSTDHGETWSQRSLPTGSIPHQLEHAFVSDREGYVMSTSQPGTQCQFQEVGLWRTADAGATYDRVPAAGISGVDCKRGLSFIDAQRGFLSTWSPNNPPFVYRTIDGGLSWVRSQPLPDPPSFTTQPAASSLRIEPGPIRAFGSIVLLQAFGNILPGPRHFVYRSTDGGATWSYLASAPEPTAVAFVTASRWVRITGAGQGRQTTDGGQSWHTFASNYSQAAPTPPVVTFVDAEVGYAAGSRGGLQRTLDGGISWTSLRPPGLN